MAKRAKDDLKRYLIEFNYDRWERIRRHGEYRRLWERLQEAEGRLQEKKNKHQRLEDRLGFYTTRFFCLASEKLRSRSPELFLAPLPLSVSKRGIKNIEPRIRDIETEIGIIEGEIATIQEEIRAGFDIFYPLDPYQEYPKEIFTTDPIFVKPPVNVKVISANPSPLEGIEGFKGFIGDEEFDWEKTPVYEELREGRYLKLDIHLSLGMTLEQLLYQIAGQIVRFRPGKATKKFLRDVEANAITMCEIRDDGHLILEFDLDLVPRKELINQIKEQVAKRFKSSGTRFRDHQKYYKAWDLRQEEKSYPEIAKILWPKEYARLEKKNQPINKVWDRIPTDDEYNELVAKQEECKRYAESLIAKGIPKAKAVKEAEDKFYGQNPSKKSKGLIALIVRACYYVVKAEELISTALNKE